MSQGQGRHQKKHAAQPQRRFQQLGVEPLDSDRELEQRLGEPVEVRAIESAGGSVSYVFVLPDGSLRQAMP